MNHTRSRARAPGGLLLLLGLGLLAVPGAAAAQEDCTKKAADLYAGRTTDVGNVNVCNDAEVLTVTYETVSPWCLVATDLHVATAAAEIPRNPAGIPIPGRFDDGDPHPECPGTVSFAIPLADIGANGGVAAGDTVVIAAHAEVFNGATSEQEAAWAAGTPVERFTQRGNWATYFTHETRPAVLTVFVTSTLHNGNLGGLIGADAICNARASEAGLPGAGSYMAWLSDSDQSPSTRFATAAEDDTTEYRLVDGTLVARGWFDLTDGDLAHPISQSERHPEPTPTPFNTWTATTTAGTLAGTPGPSAACGNWTRAASILHAIAGLANMQTSHWTVRNDPECGDPLHLYCFQQP